MANLLKIPGVNDTEILRLCMDLEALWDEWGEPARATEAPPTRDRGAGDEVWDEWGELRVQRLRAILRMKTSDALRGLALYPDPEV